MNYQYANHPDVRSAQTLVTVALVLYGVFGAFLFLAGFFFFLFIALGVISFVFLAVVYTSVQEPLKRGDVGRARTPALVLGIISILLTNLISGILLLVAYSKINRVDATLKAGGWTGTSMGAPTPSAFVGPTAPAVPTGGARYCASCGVLLTPSARFCTNCGTPVPSQPGSPAND